MLAVLGKQLSKQTRETALASLDGLPGAAKYSTVEIPANIRMRKKTSVCEGVCFATGVLNYTAWRTNDATAQSAESTCLHP